MISPTIYEQMSMIRLEISAAQISLLNNYDPKGMRQRAQELYNVSHLSIIDEQSEKSIEKMEELIRQYQEEINRFRELFPEIERKEKVRKNIIDLENLCSSCGI